jgi:hypothetical protein
MNSLIVLSGVSEPVITNITQEFNRLIPDFCRGNAKYRSKSDLYSFFLSTEDNWSENLKQVYNTLTVIEPVLRYARSQGALLEINICIHAYDYRNHLLMEFVLPKETSRIISDIGIELVMSIYLDNLFDC